MEKRVILAIFLSFLVVYLFQALLVKPLPKPAAPRATATQAIGTTAAIPSNSQGSPNAASASQAEAPLGALPAAAGVTALVGDTGEHEVRVETKDVIAVFTNRGARLKSWRLKHFLDQQKEPLELIASELAKKEPLPFSLRVSDEAVTATLNGALYAVTGAPTVGREPSAPADVRFEYRDSAGVHAVKEFHLDASSYVVTFHATVTHGDRALAPAIQWGAAVGDVSAETSRYIANAEGLLSVNGKIQRLSPSDLTKQPTYEGDFAFAGVDDQYFMTAAILPRQAKVTYQPVSIPPPDGSKESPRELVSYAIEPAPAGTPIRFFAGPKDFDVLASIDRQLVRAINFGMFDFIVVPLLRSLTWINGYVGNYGWSIILLTIIINAIMFPLKHKSVLSMRKMQEIQPEVKAIQDRYAKLKATDPGKQKMNQELMALYKERGVNPASGCVPMLLTLPVLFAFYSLLSTAIELRGAPFVGWIHDLSAHDPLYITPALMGASQFWQQRITPAAGADPAQRMTMMMMPVVFTFMFLRAPAGVALYWLMSNLWGIGQQYLTNYLIGPPNIRPIRPPAQRQMKRVGASKTDAAAREN